MDGEDRGRPVLCAPRSADLAAILFNDIPFFFFVRAVTIGGRHARRVLMADGFSALRAVVAKRCDGAGILSADLFPFIYDRIRGAVLFCMAVIPAKGLEPAAADGSILFADGIE